MSHAPDDETLPEMSSPACAMAEADDVYMGYAGEEEVRGFLAELRKAEERPEEAAAWARKLRAMLPRIRNDRLHADLAARLSRLEARFAPASATIPPPRDGET